MSHILQSLNLYRIILLYLAVPSFIFLISWLQILYGVLASVLLVLSIYKVWGLEKGRLRFDRWKQSIPILVFSFFITTLSGLGGFGHQNSDHEKHNAMIHDLTVKSWPLQYEKKQWQPLVYSVGMYLPATLIGKVFSSVMVSRVFLILWISFGLSLVFFLLIKSINFYKPLLLLTFVLFGGFDIVGYLLYSPVPLWLGAHIEWWGTLFQYSSHGTQIMWVPQHCIPAWLLTGVIWNNKENTKVWGGVCLFGFLVSTWSVFASFGIALLYPMLLLWQSPKKSDLASNAPAFPLLVINILFYLSSSNDIDSDYIFKFYPFTDFWLNYIMLLMLELVVLVVVVALMHRAVKIKKLMFIVLFVFSILPIYRLGSAHDLAMRASIPVFYILYILLLSLLRENIKRHKVIPVMIIVLCLSLGSVASLMEFYRAVTYKRHEYKWEVELPDTRFSSQYFGDDGTFFFKHLSKKLKNIDER